MAGTLITQEAVRIDTEHNPVTVYLAHLPSKGAQYTMLRSLETIARLVSSGKATAEQFAWERMRYVHVNAVRAALMRQYAPATANKHLSALRGILRTCRRLGLVGADECEATIDGAQNVPGSRIRERHMIEAEDAGKVIAACLAEQSEIGQRDAAMLALLYASGLRRGEVAGLQIGDITIADNRSVVRVHKAKGNKEREVPLHPAARNAIVDWIYKRGYAPGPLFCKVGKGGRVDASRALSGSTILNIVRARVIQAGLDPAIKTHDWRASWITELWRRGADGPTIAALAGHSSIETTQQYRLDSEEDRRDAIGLLEVPYERR